MTKKMRLWMQLPEEMRAVDRWLVTNQLTKVPLNEGRVLSDAWLSFEQACSVAHPDPKLCLSFVTGNGWTCLDVDNQHMTGAIADWARKQEHYAEYSLNNGIHVWYPPGSIINVNGPTLRADVWSTFKAVICTGRKL